jgi:hypothetical protein
MWHFRHAFWRCLIQILIVTLTRLEWNVSWFSSIPLGSILEVLDSNRGWHTDCREWSVSWFSSVPPGKRQGSTWVRLWLLLSNSLYRNHEELVNNVPHLNSCVPQVILVVRRALSVWQWDMGWMARVQFLAVQEFSLLHSIRTDSGAHPASYPMGTLGSFSGVWTWPLTSI